MSDDIPKPKFPTADFPTSDVLVDKLQDAAPEKRTTIAVHDDELWGGPRRIDGLAGRPYVETKTQYWRLLNEAGVHMQDQQESVTGPAREPVPHLGLELEPEPVVAPMTQEEAHVFGAVTAIWNRYELKESIWCDDCFARGRYAACRMQVSTKQVLLQCRCGIARYVPPVGTTDLVLSQLPTIGGVRPDLTSGSVMTEAGPVYRPTAVLHDMEALILHRYLRALVARHKEPRLFHRACWSGNPLAEDQAVAIAASPEQLVLTCACRTLFHQRRRLSAASTPPLRVM
jgi:hypothetical protein